MNLDTQQPSLVLVIASGLVALILQIVLAPVITLFGVVPNFVMAAVIVTAMNNNALRSTVFGFVLGLLFDLCSLGPVGSMTLVLTIMGYAVSSLNKGTFTGGVVVDLIVLFVAVALGEFLVSVIYAIVGVNQEFLLSLIQRVLPAILYDTLIGFVFILIYHALSEKNSGGNTRMGGGSGRPINRKLNR